MTTASLLSAEVAQRQRPPALRPLLRSLDLWTVATGHYLLRPADPEAPCVPGAELVAGVVVAAERAVPGCAVRMLSWTPGAPADPRRPVRIAVGEARAGAGGEVSLDVTITQRSAAGQPRRPHGHAVVVLREGPTGSEAETMQRALLAYWGEALAMPGSPEGAQATTLAYSIAFVAPVDLRRGLALARDSSESAATRDGYAHALARFVAPDGTAVAQVSQAALIQH